MNLNVSCDAGYEGYTRNHLLERVEGHTRKPSSIYKHYSGTSAHEARQWSTMGKENR